MEKVLVVDDEFSNILILKKALQNDCAVLHTTKSNEALDMFLDQQPDIVILDIEMPEMNGFELCAVIQLEAEKRDIPQPIFVFITSHDGSDYEEKALNLGAVDFISKPINLLVCRLRINNHLKIIRQKKLIIQSKQELHREKEHLKIILRSINDSVIATDAQGNVSYMNPAAQRITDWDEAQALGKPVREIMRLTEHNPDNIIPNPIEIAIKEKRTVAMALNTYLTSKKGTRYQVEDSASPIINDAGEILGGVTVFQDVTETMAMVTQMTHLTQHDQLTGLPNRVLLHDRIIQASNKANIDGDLVAALVIDIDNFMYLNDSLGHKTGDELIIYFANKFKNLAGDKLTVCRLGGDEFVFMLSSIQSITPVIQTANKILSEVRQPFFIGEEEIHVTASVGVSVYPLDAKTPDELIRNADAAMYKAKKNGKDCFWFYSDQLSEELTERSQIERILRQKLKERDLAVFYQPKFYLFNKTTTGVEALVRMISDDGSVITPDKFINIAEETGLIYELGEQVLDKSCEIAALWHKKDKPLKVSVNISALQFNNNNFCALVESKLTHYQLPAHLLELEITETALIDNFEQAQNTLNQLKQLGVLIALDDFGTGYSSLSYLKNFPLDTIKVDKSFVDTIENDKASMSVLKAIVSLAKSLRLRLVCEGIETEGQLNTLKMLQCEEGQGYFYSKPLPVDVLEEFLNS